jgi:hypothetical protein
MSTRADRDSLWWDREVDDDGNPVRTDVRQAACKLWPYARKSVEKKLHDLAGAPEVLEAAVFHVSRHLDRGGIPLFQRDAFSLLRLRIRQEIRYRAKKLNRLQLIGDDIDIVEQLAAVQGWAERIDRRLDFSKGFCHLNETSRSMILARLQAQGWEIVGPRFCMSGIEARKAFWKDVHEVFSRLSRGDGALSKKGRKK